jgi:hypothetical protein
MKKDNLILYVYFIIVIIVLLYGCTTQETVKTTTVYLQEMELTGPINQSPIHISDSSDTPAITFSPRFSYSIEKSVDGKIAGHTLVNQNGVFEIDTVFNSDGTINHYEEVPGANRYTYKGNNLFWNIPAVTAGLDIDFKITRNFALFGGVNYTNDNNISLWGGNFGLGVYGASKKGLAFRLDAGAHIQSISYDAYTIESVEITGPSATDDYVIFYHDVDESTNLNPFINLTINSCYPDWIFNFFVNAGYSWQTLADFEPKEPDEDYYNELDPFYSYREIVYDLRGESTIGFFHFTPGLIFNFGDYTQLLIGSRFYFISELNEASSSLFIMPMMQFDFTL